MRKLFLFIILCLFIFGCGGLDRDNPLDPKNPNSSVERAILVELFVNDSTGFDYCNYALDAIERLARREEFKDNLYVLEYHLTNRTSNWNDVYALDEFNQRYYQYVPNLNERGIPDAMFNGLVKRVQGASLENIENRYFATADIPESEVGDRSIIIRVDHTFYSFTSDYNINIQIWQEWYIYFPWGGRILGWNLITYVAFGALVAAGIGSFWNYYLKYPKMVRRIRGMIKTIRKGKTPIDAIKTIIELRNIIEI